ncbi:MAG: SDR family NAD(P)-dependent oxidoreductase [Chloroflexi bacterium]|nr:SDR family NAD(P)-dependent oxidoreductase [Chloroflexota bacterium]
MQQFEGRVAVVTGGASGIGRALATRFAAEGMRVVLADVERDALEATAAELRDGGAEVLAVETDVSSAESVEALADRAYEAFGAVHVVCNNAGVGGANVAAYRATLADWEWTLGVNLWGVIHGVRAFVPRMLDGGEEGHVVNTASIAGLTPLAGNAPYGVSKAGVVALSEALYLELERRGAPVRASVLCPGIVNTNILDSGRNRPEALRNPEPPRPDPAQERLRDEFARSAIAPAEVAATVIEAIRDQRFWILTHDIDSWIRRRSEGILSRANPQARPRG